jgi:hypothetical protein
MGTFFGKSKEARNTLSLLQATRLSGLTPLLWGNPGIGKTALIKALAELEGAELRILIGSTLDPTDIAGLPFLGKNTEGQPITQSTLPDWADALNKAAIAGRRAILFLDEISTSTPAVQASLLSLIQGRLVGQHKLHDDVWIIAAANDSSVAADGWELAPPMANRFLHVDYAFNKDDWFEGMRVAFGKDVVSESEKLWRDRIVAFLRSHDNSINAMPDDATLAGKAWPSPRTWDNSAVMLGSLEDRAVQRIAMRGFVGEATESAFDVWLKTLKLPEYSLVIAQPESLNWKNFKADEVWMILNMVLDNAKMDNLEKTAKVFEIANLQGGRTDICASLALPLIEKANKIFAENGVTDKKILLNLFKTYSPQLKLAGVTNS